MNTSSSPISIFSHAHQAFFQTMQKPPDLPNASKTKWLGRIAKLKEHGMRHKELASSSVKKIRFVSDTIERCTDTAEMSPVDDLLIFCLSRAHSV